MFSLTEHVGNQTKVKNLKTATGVKDTYLDHFIDLINDSYKSATGPKAKQTTLSQYTSTLPDNIYSPVWRIKGMF